MLRVDNFNQSDNNLNHIGTRIPAFQGCVTDKAKSFPYCNQSLSYEQRLDWLIANMTFAEKAALVYPDPNLGDSCTFNNFNITPNDTISR